jgi:transposase-like protein
MMQERGIEVDPSTIFRWVQRYAPEIEKRVRRYQGHRSGSWRGDETYVRVGGKWKYLFRAVDKHGQLIDFMLSDRRNTRAAYRFLRRAVKTLSDYSPASITTDKLASYPKAIRRLQNEGLLPGGIAHRTSKYLNNIIEADHGALKRVIRPTRGFQSMENGVCDNQGLRGDADDPPWPLRSDTARSDRRSPPHQPALRSRRLKNACGRVRHAHSKLLQRSPREAVLS